MSSVDAVILASGLSRRMGVEKLLLPFGEVTVLEYFLQRLPFSLFNRVFLITSDAAAAIVEKKYPLTIIINETREQGKSQAIRLGARLSQAVDGVLFCVADQPLLKETTIYTLLQSFLQHPEYITIPRAAGKSRNPVIFPAALRPELQQLHGDEGGKVVIRKNKERLVYVDFDNAEQFCDLDTPEKYQALLRTLAGKA